jgi:hypothetical protein
MKADRSNKEAEEEEEEEELSALLAHLNELRRSIEEAAQSREVRQTTASMLRTTALADTSPRGAAGSLGAAVEL